MCWADKTGALAAATVPPRSHLIGKSESLYMYTFIFIRCSTILHNLGFLLTLASYPFNLLMYQIHGV